MRAGKSTSRPEKLRTYELSLCLIWRAEKAHHVYKCRCNLFIIIHQWWGGGGGVQTAYLGGPWIVDISILIFQKFAPNLILHSTMRSHLYAMFYNIRLSQCVLVNKLQIEIKNFMQFYFSQPTIKIVVVVVVVCKIYSHVASESFGHFNLPEECWPTAKRPQRFLNTRRKMPMLHCSPWRQKGCGEGGL